METGREWYNEREREEETEGYGSVVHQRDPFNSRVRVWDYMYRLDHFGSVSQVINYSRLFRVEESGAMQSTQQVISSQGGNYLSLAIMIMNLVRGTHRMSRYDEHQIDLDMSNVLVGITMDNHVSVSNCYLFIICHKNNYVYCYDLREGRE